MYRQPTWKIAVYGGDHGMPHFHIEGRTFRCSISISTRELIVGGAPATVLAAARAWPVEHEAS